MPKKSKALSAIEVKRISQSVVTINTPFPVGGVAGLNLQVTPSGATSWILRVSIGGVKRNMGLGGYPDVDLKTAREEARKARLSISHGIDPIKERRDNRAALALQQSRYITFRQAAYKVHAVKESEFTNAKHAKQWITTLETYAFPVIGDVSVDNVQTEHVMRVLEPIWYDKTETASRVRNRMEAVFRWAIASKLRKEGNPASWTDNLKALLPSPSKIKTVKNQPSLNWKRIPEFFASVTDGESVPCMKFGILNANRSIEARMCEWQDIDLEEQIWTIPASKMKAKKEHRIPLSEQAMEILKAQPRDGVYVFTHNGKTLSENAFTHHVRRFDCTFHGFRSTFKEWVRANCPEFQDEVSELALAHVGNDATRAAYARDGLIIQRRQLMNLWGQYCLKAA